MDRRLYVASEERECMIGEYGTQERAEEVFQQMLTELFPCSEYASQDEENDAAYQITDAALKIPRIKPKTYGLDMSCAWYMPEK